MGFFKKLSNLFSSGSSPLPEYATYFYVKCNRCGEVIRVRIDLRNDLTANYDTGDSFYCRKVIIGEKRCFQTIEAELTFDSKRQIINRQISGGVFVEAP